MIELAIVLVIIGLILGSVLKGRDMINSAKQKHFYNSFIKAWKLSVVSYRDRTGQLLGDGTINGGIANSPNGEFDRINNNAKFVTIGNRLKAVGLEVPVSNTAHINRYAVQGVHTDQTVAAELRFRHNNMLILRDMPTDVAMALDTIIDGRMDPQAGTFRIYTAAAAADTWPAANAHPHKVDVFVML